MSWLDLPLLHCGWTHSDSGELLGWRNFLYREDRWTPPGTQHHHWSLLLDQKILRESPPLTLPCQLCSWGSSFRVCFNDLHFTFYSLHDKFIVWLVTSLQQQPRQVLSVKCEVCCVMVYFLSLYSCIALYCTLDCTELYTVHPVTAHIQTLVCCCHRDSGREKRSWARSVRLCQWF